MAWRRRTDLDVVGGLTVVLWLSAAALWGLVIVEAYCRGFFT